MTSAEYQELTRRTWNSKLSRRDGMLNAALGVGGEAGEVQELFKKHCFHDKPLDVEKVKKECGDVLYYLARVADISGFTLEEAMEENVRKLQERHPNGFNGDYAGERD